MRENLKAKTLFISLVSVGIISAQALYSRANLALQHRSDMTPLMSAAKNGNLKELRKLLRNKKELATIDMQDRNGNTALIQAAMVVAPDRSEVYIKVARALLKKDANPNIRNRQGKTAFFYAEKSNNTKMMDLLICYKADTTEQAERTETINPCDCP